MALVGSYTCSELERMAGETGREGETRTRSQIRLSCGGEERERNVQRELVFVGRLAWNKASEIE